MNVRRIAGLTVAAGLLVTGLSLAPAATAEPASSKTKCDPPSGTRVGHSESGNQKVNARGCVEIKKLKDGGAAVTGVLHAAAYEKSGSGWSLVPHKYDFSCKIVTTASITGRSTKSENNGASASNGQTVGPCAATTLDPGSYEFQWSYGDRGSSAHTSGKVSFQVEGNALLDAVRQMPQIDLS